MTVRQVLAALPDGKKRAYTTVLTVLQIMEKKGLIEHERQEDGVAHVYRPLVQRRQVVRPVMRNLLRDLFGGKRSMAMQYLISEGVSAEELAEVRKVIEAAAKKRR